MAGSRVQTTVLAGHEPGWAPLVFAAWCGLGFGLLEGVVLWVARLFPVLLAPYKISPHVLWVAPLFDVALCVLVTGVGWLVLRASGRWLGGNATRLSLLIPVIVGAAGVLNAPRLLHPAAALILAAGLTVGPRAFWFGLARRLTGGSAVSRLAAIPLVLALVAGGVSGSAALGHRRALAALPDAGAGAMNVIVLVLDTVRYDSFEDRMTPASATPHLDEISRRATWFDQAWSTSSWSLPSQASLLTGRQPEAHGADWPRLELRRDIPTLPEIFAQHGYVTGAFSGNAAWITPEYVGRGFHEFKVYSAENHLRRTSYGRVLSRALDLIGVHRAGRGRKAPDLNRDLEAFIDDAGDRPFFAYVCYMDVNQTFHHRLLNHPAWTQAPPMTEVQAAYMAGLRTLDEQIGRLFDRLESRGVLDRTIVVVVSDHGESFGETVPGDHEPAGHGTSLYVEQSRVPLFILDPRPGATPHRVTAPTSIELVPHQLMDLLGWPTSTLGSPERDAALASLRYDGRALRAIATGPWHYIENALAEPQRQLFDLATDPHETRNLDGLQPLPEAIGRLLGDAGFEGRHDD